MGNNFYNSTTLKSIEMPASTMLLFDLVKSSKTNVALITSLYQSSYKEPINLSLIRVFNKSNDVGFGTGYNLNILYQLSKSNQTITLTHPTFDTETFVSYSTQTDVNGTTFEIYHSQTTKNTIYYNSETQEYTYRNDSCEVTFDSTSFYNKSYTYKTQNGNYTVDIAYNSTYGYIGSISNRVSDTETMTFSYSRTYFTYCSQIVVTKRINMQIKQIEKITLGYSGTHVNSIKNYVLGQTTPQYEKTFTTTSPIVVTDVVSGISSSFSLTDSAVSGFVLPTHSYNVYYDNECGGREKAKERFENIASSSVKDVKNQSAYS